MLSNPNYPTVCLCTSARSTNSSEELNAWNDELLSFCFIRLLICHGGIVMVVKRTKQEQEQEQEQEQRPGMGVDSRGAAVIDPTKNVLDLVRAESKYQDSKSDGLKELLRSETSALKELIAANIAAVTAQVKLLSETSRTFQNAQVSSETRRIDQLAQTRQEFQNTIRDMLAESVRTTSTLVSTQLVQIQATFDTRVSKLEAGAFTAAGRSSVQDPQTADALSRMAAGIAALSATTTEAMSKTSTATSDAIAKLTMTLTNMQREESGIGGQRKGMSDTNARLLAVVMAVAAVASPVITLLIAFTFVRYGMH